MTGASTSESSCSARSFQMLSLFIPCGQNRPIVPYFRNLSSWRSRTRFLAQRSRLTISPFLYFGIFDFTMYLTA